MIVDTSVIMAIILDEPERAAFAAALGNAQIRRISAGSWVELSAVLTRRNNPDLETAVCFLMQQIIFTIEPVTVRQAEIGHEAYRTFGRGTGHPPRLNFGDCFAYALAKATGEPLLFKGDDFARTDIAAAA